jgi:alanine dehydrogenase
MRETDNAAVARSEVYVDTYAGARSEAGDLVQAAAAGAFSMDAIRADLAALSAGTAPGRTDPGAITLFKSVGASIEDLAAARLVHRAIRAA